MCHKRKRTCSTSAQLSLFLSNKTPEISFQDISETLLFSRGEKENRGLGKTKKRGNAIGKTNPRTRNCVMCFLPGSSLLLELPAETFQTDVHLRDFDHLLSIKTRDLHKRP